MLPPPLYVVILHVFISSRHSHHRYIVLNFFINYNYFIYFSHISCAVQHCSSLPVSEENSVVIHDKHTVRFYEPDRLNYYHYFVYFYKSAC